MKLLRKLCMFVTKRYEIVCPPGVSTDITLPNFINLIIKYVYTFVPRTQFICKFLCLFVLMYHMFKMVLRD